MGRGGVLGPPQSQVSVIQVVGGPVHPQLCTWLAHGASRFCCAPGTLLLFGHVPTQSHRCIDVTILF